MTKKQFIDAMVKALEKDKSINLVSTDEPELGDLVDISMHYETYLSIRKMLDLKHNKG